MLGRLHSHPHPLGGHLIIEGGEIGQTGLAFQELVLERPNPQEILLGYMLAVNIVVKNIFYYL